MILTIAEPRHPGKNSGKIVRVGLFQLFQKLLDRRKSVYGLIKFYNKMHTSSTSKLM